MSTKFDGTTTVMTPFSQPNSPALAAPQIVEKTQEIGLPELGIVEGIHHVHTASLGRIEAEINGLNDELAEVLHGDKPGETKPFYDGQARENRITRRDMLLQNYEYQVGVANRAMDEAREKEGIKTAGMQAELDRQDDIVKRAAEILTEREAQARADLISPTFRSPLGMR